MFAAGLFFVVVSTLKQALKEEPSISQFLQAYHRLLHSKKGNWTIGRIG